MALSVDFTLTDVVHRATGGGVWDAFVAGAELVWVRQRDGSCESLVRVEVRTLYPHEGFGPPESLTLSWYGEPAAVLPGQKVRVYLVHARGYHSPMPPNQFADEWGVFDYLNRHRLTVEGDWALVVGEEADTPYVVGEI